MENFTVEGHLLKAKASVLRGDFRGAFILYQEILRESPGNREARTNIRAAEDAITLSGSPDVDVLRGLLALYDSKDFKTLSERLSNLLADYPRSIFLWNLTGRMHWTLGNGKAAEEAFSRTTDLTPYFAPGHNNLGVLLSKKGLLDEAAESFRRAIEIRPDYAEAYNNLGTTLQARGELDKAIDCFSRALEIEPDGVAAYSNLGNAFRQKGRWEDAIECLSQATERHPDEPEPYCTLGIVFRDLAETGKAIESFSQAIKLNPGHAQAHSELGKAFADMGQVDRAIELQLTAIELKPDDPGLLCTLGKLFYHKGNLGKSLDAYRQALKIKPDMEAVRVQVLHQKRNICDWTPEPGIDETWKTRCLGAQCADPFYTLPLDDDPKTQRQRAVDWARKKFWKRPLCPSPPERPRIRPPKLRIGYFSSDFSEHAVFYLISGLLREHDRDRFEIHAYSYGETPAEKHRAAIGGHVDGFTDIRNLPGPRTVDTVQAHKLDIAIDLNGHTRFSRSDLFAFRLAPIQVNYLGYPGTIGADFMDYIIADPVLIPEEYRDGYTENVIYLPDSFMPNDDSRSIAETGTSRAGFGLPEDGFVFCSFNNPCKISPAEFDIWMRLLKQVDGSVLWLSATPEMVKANLRKEAVARGVDAERIVFAERLPSLGEHLARHKHADLFLDTFNYNAHTTASDALWAGLPVVTKIGRQFAARVAASLLTAVGLPELITANEQEYERLILELAADPRGLSEVREKLAHNRTTHPLFDTVRYTRHFEQAMDQAYDRYLKGLPPEDLRIGVDM